MSTEQDPGAFRRMQRSHGYILNDDGRDVWASCTCGWTETGARHGDRRWREYATACAWDAHIIEAQAREWAS